MVFNDISELPGTKDPIRYDPFRRGILANIICAIVYNHRKLGREISQVVQYGLLKVHLFIYQRNPILPL